MSSTGAPIAATLVRQMPGFRLWGLVAGACPPNGISRGRPLVGALGACHQRGRECTPERRQGKPVTLVVVAALSALFTPLLLGAREVERPASPSLHAITATSARALQSQEAGLLVRFTDGSEEWFRLSFDGGSASVPLMVFEALGWSVTAAPTGVVLGGPNNVRVSIAVGSPFVDWDGSAIHLVDPPHRGANGVQVPLQLLSEVAVESLRSLYRFDHETLTLDAASPETWGYVPPNQVERVAPPIRPSEPPSRPDAAEVAEGSAPAERASDELRVVVIDAGHGGGDPGAIGLGGIREKDVALGVALALERILSDAQGLDVRMTRSSDHFVPLWDRGEMATEWKGERLGVFVSLHANSLPSRRSIRGFETYFLSESRTDHERRIAAIENAPLSIRGQAFDPTARPEIGSILRDLRALDMEHWSSLLAEFVQREMGVFHPGPDRGVRQGVLAVLTNALMPSVLVELGYLSNADEAPILAQEAFQKQAAAAIARAVMAFFERYPPGAENWPRGPQSAS